jgi:HK97 family phage prohead protease
MTTTVICGYGIAWFDQATDGRDYSFAPGCYDWWLAQCHGPKLLYGHQDRLLLASRMRGDLEVWSDDYGLAFRAEVPNAAMPYDLHERLMRGEVGTSAAGERLLKTEHDFLNGFGRGGDGMRETVASWPLGRVVTKATLSELTILPGAGAFPMARAWLHDAGYWDQQPHIRAQIDRWRSPRVGPEPARGVGRAPAAKPVRRLTAQQPVSMSSLPRARWPAAPQPYAWLGRYTPQALAGVDPVRRMMREHIARYMARAPILPASRRA